MRILDFDDGFESNAEPTQGTLTFDALQVFASDAAFEADKGTGGAGGDIYYNSASDVVRYFDDDAAGWTTIISIAGAQVLTNKDIDGGTATDTSRITLPKETTANIAGLARKEATVIFDTTQGRAVVDDGAALQTLHKPDDDQVVLAQRVFS